MDSGLVERARHGDREAFRLMAAPLGDRLFSVALRVLRDSDLAADATQQAIVAVWRDLPKLRDPDRFDAWSYRLVVRACYAERRNERRWSPSLKLLAVAEPLGDGDGVRRVIDRDQLERAAQRLSIDHRSVVVLHYFVDLSAADIAELLGVPVGTVRSRLRYAMLALRASIAADERPIREGALR